MNRHDWTSGKEPQQNKCDECGQKLRPWNTGWSGDVKCKDCHKIRVEAIALQAIEKRAYYLHLENPQRSAEENWNIADAEAEMRRFDRYDDRHGIVGQQGQEAIDQLVAYAEQLQDNNE